MLVYFVMLITSVGIAAAAVFYPEIYELKINSKGKIVVFKVRNILFTLSFLPLLLVSGFRYNVGVDYNTYAWIFKAINFTTEKTHVETGYKILNKLIAIYTDNPQALFLLTSLIIVFFFARGIIENSASVPYSLFLFISLGYFFYSMNSIRHFMALSIYFFAIKYMKKQEFWKFLVCIILASGFHKIALIAIPLYFLLTQKFKISYYMIISVFLLIIAVFNKPILNFIFRFVYTSYKDSVYNIYTFSAFNILLSGICTLLAILYYRQLLEKNKSNIIFINAAIFSLLYYLFCFWIPTPTRLGHYGTILFILLIPEILSIEQSKKVKAFYCAGIGIFAVLFLIIMLNQSSDPTIQLLPYQTIFAP